MEQKLDLLELIKLNLNWKPTGQSELTPIIFNMELSHSHSIYIISKWVCHFDGAIRIEKVC